MPAGAAKVTFYDHAKKIIAERELRQRTRDKYSFELERYLKPLHHLRIRDIQPATLRTLYANLRRQELSISVRLHVHALVHLVLETARIDHLITINPAAEKGIRPRAPKVSKKEKRLKAFTRQEASQILRHAPHVLHGEIIALLLLTGMRRGEAAGLKWGDVDLQKGELHINCTRSLSGSTPYEGPCKTDASIRDLPVAPEVLELLRHVRSLNEDRRQAFYPDQPPSAYVFPTTKGTGQRPDNIRRILHGIYKQIDAESVKLEQERAVAEGRAVQEVARFRRLRPHALRHTFVTIMMSDGHTLEQVAHWIGDNPATVLAVYSHLYEEDTRMASMGLGRFVTASEPAPGVQQTRTPAPDAPSGVVLENSG